MKRFAVFLVSSLAFVVLLHGQQPQRTDADFVRKAYEVYTSMAQSSPSRTVPWQYLGPTNISGRATDVAVADVGPVRRIYAAFATSGVWQSDDRGATWRAIFEHQPSTSIGDIAVSKSNPSILYVGTGEANLFRASMPGVGVFKSSDGGRTFSHAGLADTHTIARILIHPTNPDIVYVAASGHAWTENEMRGVFKTTDGGRTWTKVLYKSPGTGAIDLVMDPSDPNTLYAATWQRTRRKWSDPRVEPGASESGVWKSTDAGSTWTDANRGLPPASVRGRIGLDAAASNPKVLYAFVDSYEAGRPAKEGERDAYGRPIMEARIKAAEIYRSDDRGETWRKVSATNEYMSEHSATYGWVFGQIRVDPDRREHHLHARHRPQRLARRRQDVYRARAARTATTTGCGSIPTKPATLYSANDGGFYLSDDAGKSWNYARAAGGVQLYNVTLDSSTPAWAYGSIQDDGSRRGRIDLSAGRDRIPAVEFVNAPGGEGSHHADRPRRSQHRLFARVLRELHALERRAASSATPPRRRRSGARGRTRTRRRHDQHPAAVGRRRAARAVDGADHHVACTSRA